MIIGAIGTSSIQNLTQKVWLKNTIQTWLARWDVRLAYTNLEGESSLLFAEIVKASEIPFRIILPPLNSQELSDITSDIKGLLHHSAALHYLEESSENAWLETRLMIIENCEVLLVLLSGDPKRDKAIKELQSAACAAEVAVLTLDPSAFRTTVKCKFEKW